MGMYTELVLAIELKKDTPENVLDIVQYLAAEWDGEAPPVPEHQFFRNDYWEAMLTSDSNYLVGEPNIVFIRNKPTFSGKYSSLTVRSQVRSNEPVDDFLDWIAPYCEEGSYSQDGFTFAGFLHYEASYIPQLIYFKEGIAYLADIMTLRSEPVLQYQTPNIKPGEQKQRHDKISANLMDLIWSNLDSSEYHYSRWGMYAIQTEGNGYFTYPDAMVIRGKLELVGSATQSVDNPILIIEVLDDATREYDRTDKFEIYKGLASLQQYVLIDADRPYIQSFRRLEDNRWALTTYRQAEERLPLVAGDLELELAQIYQGVEFPAKPLVAPQLGV
jgi:Uma2 family endonuclease